jgi:sarcosine oxidase
VAETYDLAVIGLGALGSSTAWHAARRGLSVLGLEQFELGHERGASHDSSRILRHSYHTPEYVDLTFLAYDDWAALEAETGEALVTVTGGLDLFPAGAVIPIDDYTASMTARSVPFEILGTDEVAARYPQLVLPEGTTALYQERTAIVPAARGTAAMQRRALAHGAVLRDRSPVRAIVPRSDGVDLVLADGTAYSAARVVVAADAWTSRLLAPLGWDLPLTVTEEQVTYFTPADPEPFRPGRFPVWIWMDEPSYYGFPTYGEDTIKSAQDCGGPTVTGDERSLVEDPAMRDRLADFMARTFPASGPATRSKRCLYTLTSDRDFVVSAVPGHEQVVVGLGAAHGFKFAACFGRLLTDLAVDGTTPSDISAFTLDRPALTDPAYEPNWMV